MTELESERQLTVATFDFNTFKDVYRREAAKLFEEALQLLSERSKRQTLIALLGDPARLTRRDLEAVEELAIDEFEDKHPRKLAIAALTARGGASPDAVLALLASKEQGVQRAAIAGLSHLYVERPADPGFLDDCISLANDSDDTGVTRRLIPAMFQLGVAEAVRALDALDLEANEEAIRHENLTLEAINLLNRCLVKTEDAGWLARCRSFIHRLESDS